MFAIGLPLITTALSACGQDEKNFMNPVTAPYGEWKSPITAALIADGSSSISNLHLDGPYTYWSELRPKNKGRFTLVRRDAAGNQADMTPDNFDVRTRVHEYGGGAFNVKNGVVYASNGIDAQVYRIEEGKDPVKLTDDSSMRFANIEFAPDGLLAVAEKHEDGAPVENFLVWIDEENGEWRKITGGYDFYSSPITSVDGRKLAWVCWNNPEMPWTKSELWAADLGARGEITRPKLVAGENESIFQPGWHPDGSLLFVSDRDSGWWNLYSYASGEIKNLLPLEAEFAVPQWEFQHNTWALLSPSELIFSFTKEGWWQLGVLDLTNGKPRMLDTKAGYISFVQAGSGRIEYLKYPGDSPKQLMQINTSLEPAVLKVFRENEIDPGYIAIPEHISYPSGGRTAYAWYIPPKNKDYQAPAGEKPPLIVMIHGGPTYQTPGVYSLKIAYWTSRGFAVLDVNYGGSTGYGRNYRSLLDRNWGVVDVEDCVNGAAYLAQQGVVDSDRLFIRGGSAGGYTTLAALAFKDVFKGGASYYGIADLEVMARDTHKFEGKYLDMLLGPYPEEKQIWIERSPIHSVQNIKSPLIIFQGAKDKIVPENQAVMIHEALETRGIPSELHIYPEEEHGFRYAENIIHSLESELSFYQKLSKNK